MRCASSEINNQYGNSLCGKISYASCGTGELLSDWRDPGFDLDVKREIFLKNLMIVFMVLSFLRSNLGHGTRPVNTHKYVFHYVFTAVFNTLSVSHLPQRGRGLDSYE
jgi:hypothetical protein